MYILLDLDNDVNTSVGVNLKKKKKKENRTELSTLRVYPPILLLL